MQWLPLSRHSAQTSPGTTRFFLSIHPLHLPYMIPCSYRASACKAVLPSCMAFYVISVRQTGDLPVVSLFPHPASFRFHLAMDTLTFGYILPTTWRIRDLHPLETCAAGRTLTKQPPRSYPGRLFSYLFSFSNTVSRLRLVIFPFLSYDMDNLNLQPRGDLCTLTPGINGLHFFICTVSLAGSLNPPTFP